MGTDETPKPASPNEELAGLILDDLVEAGLIDGSARAKQLPRVIAGKVASADWRVILAPPKTQQGKVTP